MTSVWIFTATCYYVCFSLMWLFNTDRLLPSRATVPHLSHIAAVGASGERRGAAAKLGERRARKNGGVVGVANNRYD